MNALVDANEGQSNGKPRTDSKAKSPVEFFEQHAHAIWNSELDPTEKALKLYSVSDSIAKYLRKAQVELAERARSQDGWTNLACNRGTAYLEQLAIDLRRLAIQCQQANLGEKA